VDRIQEAAVTIDNSQYVVIGIFVLYMLIVGILWKVNHVDYATIGDTTRNAQRGIVIPIGAGAIMLAIATTALGAWHDVLFEPERSGPAWLLVAPGASELLPWLALGTLLVGFAEEVVTRGLMVVGFREAGWSSLTVYLVSTVCFALLHGINAFFGQSAKVTITQMVMTLAAGTALYVIRLSTGTLITGIVLHALWDFGTLGLTATKRPQKPLGGVLAFAMFGIALVGVWFAV
jgi:uncharacterized protein